MGTAHSAWNPVLEQSKLKSLVVVPTLNEERNIAKLIARLRDLPSPPDVLVVDDSSPDKTAEIVRGIAQRDLCVHLLERDEKRSFSGSYMDGFRYAIDNGYEALVCMDADMSHSPDDVPRLLSALDKADIVIGSRYTGSRATVVNWPLRRRVLSRISSMYVRLITGLPLTDPMAGFKAYRVDCLKRLDMDAIVSQGFAFQTESVYRLFKTGARLGEVSIVFTDRLVGSSKMSAKRILEAISMPIKLVISVKGNEDGKKRICK
jgi:dolichol-phosphate mannosyltransferase